MRLRLIEDELWPSFSVATDDLEGNEEQVIQVEDSVARRYLRAVRVLEDAEQELLGWLHNNKNGDANRAIPAVMENFERKMREQQEQSV